MCLAEFCVSKPFGPDFLFPALGCSRLYCNELRTFAYPRKYVSTGEHSSTELNVVWTIFGHIIWRCVDRVCLRALSRTWPHWAIGPLGHWAEAWLQKGANDVNFDVQIKQHLDKRSSSSVPAWCHQVNPPFWAFHLGAALKRQQKHKESSPDCCGRAS